jgi:hypothetical protein
MLRLLHAMLALASLLYAGWYYAHDHTALTDWWMRLESRFYGAANWRTQVFTPEVYAAGRVWCWVAVAAAVLAWAAYEYVRRDLPDLNLTRQKSGHFWPILGIFMLGSTLWWIGTQACPYATDEVFSAVHFARLPAFQTLAYYALPNNHILYNLLNGTLDGLPDGVAAGRMLSGLCYVATLCVVYFFTLKCPNPALPPIWSLFILAIMGIQFPAWGFGTQARGYALLLLLSWGSLWAWWQHHTPHDKPTLTLPHPIWTASLLAAGMWTVPTALYWWLGLILAAIVVQVRQRRSDPAWWYAQVLAAALTLLAYLPALTFSGVAALTDNKYVAVRPQSVVAFATEFDHVNYWHGLFAEWWALTSESAWVGWILLFFPLIIGLFVRLTPHLRRLVLVYGCVLLALVAVVMVQRRWPFYRNLAAQGHLALFVVCLLATQGMSWLEARLGRWRMVVMAGAMAASVAVVGITFQRNKKRLPDALYYYDLRGHYAAHTLPDGLLRAGSRVRLDDASYYWWVPLHGSVQVESGPINTSQLPDYQIITAKDTSLYDTAAWRRIHHAAGQVVLERR